VLLEFASMHGYEAGAPGGGGSDGTLTRRRGARRRAAGALPGGSTMEDAIAMDLTDGRRVGTLGAPNRAPRTIRTLRMRSRQTLSDHEVAGYT
jgi:hypothetical protein